MYHLTTTTYEPPVSVNNLSESVTQGTPKKKNPIVILSLLCFGFSPHDTPVGHLRRRLTCAVLRRTFPWPRRRSPATCATRRRSAAPAPAHSHSSSHSRPPLLPSSSSRLLCRAQHRQPPLPSRGPAARSRRRYPFAGALLRSPVVRFIPAQ
ncbi:hypothetical protein BVRB_8g184010 [Beta vulgaris subsp. vulgaris]|nr:hypothetical protein BVRB_8g184010 [Beta vulgaris subsp. vulgaris]